MSRRRFLQILTGVGAFVTGLVRPLLAAACEALTELPGGIPQAKVVAWYAARLTGGFADGTFVPTIPELSGSGAANLFQNHSAKRASFQTDEINGLSVFRFDGTDWYKALWGQTVAEPYTVFAVFNPRALPVPGKDEVIFSGWTGDGSDKHIFAIVNHDLATVNQPATPPDWMIEQAGNRQHVVGGTPVPNVWYVARVDFEDAGDAVNLNGVLTIGPWNAGHLASIGITLGAREDGNRGVTGDIAELVFCKDLTSSEKSAVEAYLMNVYAL